MGYAIYPELWNQFGYSIKIPRSAEINYILFFKIKIMAHAIPMQPISIKIPRLRPPLPSRRCDSKIGEGLGKTYRIFCRRGTTAQRHSFYRFFA
jgi:hypothetical protein